MPTREPDLAFLQNWYLGPGGSVIGALVVAPPPRSRVYPNPSPVVAFPSPGWDVVAEERKNFAAQKKERIVY